MVERDSISIRIQIYTHKQAIQHVLVTKEKLENDRTEYDSQTSVPWCKFKFLFILILDKKYNHSAVIASTDFCEKYSAIFLRPKSTKVSNQQFQLQLVGIWLFFAGVICLAHMQKPPAYCSRVWYDKDYKHMN